MRIEMLERKRRRRVRGQFGEERREGGGGR